MSDAQLVIARSGASTVADVSIVGRPAIWVPLASAIRDEQSANARQLVDAGAAILMPESMFEVDSLREQIEIVMTNEQGAMKMCHAALSCGVPDATERLVGLVENLAKGRTT